MPRLLLPRQFSAQSTLETCWVKGVSSSAIGLFDAHSDRPAEILQTSPPELVPFPHQPKRFADHFAGRVVHTRGNLPVYELLQFRRQGHIHALSITVCALSCYRNLLLDKLGKTRSNADFLAG